MERSMSKIVASLPVQRAEVKDGDNKVWTYADAAKLFITGFMAPNVTKGWSGRQWETEFLNWVIGNANNGTLFRELCVARLEFMKFWEVYDHAGDGMAIAFELISQG